MTLNRLTLASAICLALGLSACSEGAKAPDTAATTAQAAPAQAAAEPAQDNPLFSPSTLPLQAPDFRVIREEHYLPAITEGMARHLAEIRTIADNAEPATVANTLEAMERSGELLTRASQVFFNVAGTDSNDALRKIQSEVAPKLAAHQDAILLDPALFARVKALYDARESAGHDPETLRLIDVTYNSFVRAGAELSDADKVKVRALNEEQASLTTAFQQTLMKQTDRAAVIVDDVAQLDGLDAAAIAAAAKAATDAGHDGKWLLRKWLEQACPAADPWGRKKGFTVPVDAWIAPRAGEIAARIGQVEAVRRILGPEANAAFAAQETGRWPLLFFAVWSLIHLEGAAPSDALAAVAGRP